MYWRIVIDDPWSNKVSKYAELAKLTTQVTSHYHHHHNIYKNMNEEKGIITGRNLGKNATIEEKLG